MAAWRLLRERVLAMTALWTQEQAKFHGEFVNFDPVWQYPQAEAEAASADPVFNAPADRDALASYRDAGIARVLLEMHDLSCDEVLRVLDKNAPLTSGA